MTALEKIGITSADHIWANSLLPPNDPLTNKLIAVRADIVVIMRGCDRCALTELEHKLIELEGQEQKISELAKELDRDHKQQSYNYMLTQNLLNTAKLRIQSEIEQRQPSKPLTTNQKTTIVAHERIAGLIKCCKKHHIKEF